MDIFDYAMKMEKEGESFYLILASNAMNKGLKDIFNLLAKEESKHYKVFQAMKEENKIQFQEHTLLPAVKSIFKTMKEEDMIFDGDLDQKEAWIKAQELEKKSEEFYLEKSRQATDRGQKLIFQKLATEEKQHYWLLDNLIEFLARPDRWLENAEWSHFEEY